MRLSRIIGSVVATLATAGAFVIAGTPAQAQPQPPYPPTPPALTVSDATVEVGQTFTVFGSGFGGNESVRLDFATSPLAAPVRGVQPQRRDSGGVGAMFQATAQGPVHVNPTRITVRADTAGSFAVRVRFTRQLTVVITATGLTTGRTASTTVEVFRPQPGLPVTGSDSGPRITVGVLLLIGGVLMVLTAVAWRRKSRRTGRSRELTSVG